MDAIDIKHHLARAGLTQVQVAQDLGVSHVAVAHVIHGRSRSTKIESALAEQLGLELAELWPKWHGPKPPRRTLSKAARQAGLRAAAARKFQGADSASR